MSDLLFVTTHLGDYARARRSFRTDADRLAFADGMEAAWYGDAVPPDAAVAFLAGHAFGMVAVGHARERSAKARASIMHRWHPGQDDTNVKRTNAERNTNGILTGNREPVNRKVSASSFVVPENSADAAAAAALQGAGSGTPAMAPPVRARVATAADRPAEVPAVGSAPIAPRIERQEVAHAAAEDLFSTDKGAAGAASPVRHHGPPIMPAASLADWRFVLPALFVSEQEDVDLARRLVVLYGSQVAPDLRDLQAAAMKRPPGKQRVFIKELQEFLARKWKLEPADYERAGMMPV